MVAADIKRWFSKQQTFSATLLTVVVAFVTGLGIPLLALLTFRGIESQQLFEKATFHFGIGAFSLIAAVAMALLSLRYQWWETLFYSPKVGLLNQFSITQPIVKFLTWGNLVHIGVIFGLLWSLLSAVTQSFIGVIPQTFFEVSNLGKLILSIEPASTTETAFGIIGLSIYYTIWLWFIRKNNLGKGAVVIALLSGVPFSILQWVSMHVANYGASEPNLIATAIFAAIGSFWTVITGSWIIWWIWHSINNFFLKLVEIFPALNVETIIITSLVSYIIFVIAIKVIKARRARAVT